MDEPVFAVVGHPNKGKSSIVATLAQDDSVRISPRAGTTVQARMYPMKIDGRLMYSLVDTPGFQRPRKALAWMKEHETTADKHPQVVRSFVNAHRGGSMFYDECELLTPILDGAGILYVVDGSVPYGPEYEAEMEILRWTGQPSMALINPIGRADHVADWEAGLGQYFRVVRVFNAMSAEFEKHLELLRAFGQLRETWRAPLEEAVRVLQEDRRARHQRAAVSIATMLSEMLMLVRRQAIHVGEDMDAAKAKLRERYLEDLRRLERRCRREVEEAYWHSGVQRREEDMGMPMQDLFAQETWVLWGLRRSHLAWMGAASGAAVGGGIDAAVGGTSMLAGLVIGAALGAAGGLLGAGKLAEVKVGPLRLGGRQLRIGPMANVSFPYVVLGRALWHQRAISQRNHACRAELDLGLAASAGAAADRWLGRLAGEAKKNLDRALAEARRGGGEQKLAGVLGPMMERSPFEGR